MDIVRDLKQHTYSLILFRYHSSEAAGGSSCKINMNIIWKRIWFESTLYLIHNIFSKGYYIHILWRADKAKNAAPRAASEYTTNTFIIFKISEIIPVLVIVYLYRNLQIARDYDCIFISFQSSTVFPHILVHYQTSFL